MGEMDDLLKEFLIESTENLDQLDRDLVALEKDPASPQTLGSIFRTIHTIKGTCGFLAFGKLEALTHAGENLLSRLRDGQLTLNPEITTVLLAMVDAVRQMLAAIEATSTDGKEDYGALIEALRRLQAGTVDGSPPEVSATDTADDPDPGEGAEDSLALGEILINDGQVDPGDVAEALRQ